MHTSSLGLPVCHRFCPQCPEKACQDTKLSQFRKCCQIQKGNLGRSEIFFLPLCQKWANTFSQYQHIANVERVFSLMSTQWTDERNRLSVETVQNILICQYNYNQTCVEFYDYVKNNPELLKAAKSSEI